MAPAAIYAGTAYFISFFTPDMLVYGVEPVKLSAQNELTMGKAIRAAADRLPMMNMPAYSREK